MCRLSTVLLRMQVPISAKNCAKINVRISGIGAREARFRCRVEPLVA
jgi:hypothetical protein